jgi:hypothetical protein
MVRELEIGKEVKYAVVEATQGRPGIPFELERKFEEMKKSGGRIVFIGAEHNDGTSTYMIAQLNPQIKE